MGVTGVTCRETYLLIQPSTGTCIQWRATGVFEDLMKGLHEQVREQAKKTAMDNLNYH